MIIIISRYNHDEMYGLFDDGDNSMSVGTI